MEKGIAHAGDSHLFVHAYNIYPNNDISQSGSPVYKCAHCKTYTIQNVHDVNTRAHACAYQCDECHDGVVFDSPEVLVWHKYADHQPAYGSFLDKLRAVETSLQDAPVSNGDIGRAYKYLEEAAATVNKMINETGIARDNAYLACDLSKLHIKSMEDAPAIPPASFLAIAAAVCEAVAEKNNKRPSHLSDNNDTRDAELTAFIPMVLHPNCALLAANLDLKRLRDKIVKLVDIYRSTPALFKSRLVRYASNIMDRILPFALVSPGAAVEHYNKAVKRSFDTMHGDVTTIESPQMSPNGAKRARMEVTA